jgi:hypothetical protein
MSEQPDTEGLTSESDEQPVAVDEALESTSSAERESDGGRTRALDIEGANQLAARRRPTVVILAGGVATGKTSVYASLYERFGRGPFAGRFFAGSITIPGFEERCHGWRVASGHSKPEMEHTGLSDLVWLHMRIRDTERERPIQDLLFGDYNGEIFSDLAAGVEDGTDYSFLRRADHLGVILDGGDLCDPTEREAALERSTYLVEELLQPGRLADPKALFIVLSKLDLVVASGEEQREAAEGVVEQIAALIQEGIGDYEPPVLRIAARSETDRFPVGHGLNELLDLVTERPAIHTLNGPPEIDSADFFSGFRA